MQQIYRRPSMPKCDFKVALQLHWNRSSLQLYWNRTSAWVFSCKLADIFRASFSKITSKGLLLYVAKVKDFFRSQQQSIITKCNTTVTGYKQTKFDKSVTNSVTTEAELGFWNPLLVDTQIIQILTRVTQEISAWN